MIGDAAGGEMQKMSSTTSEFKQLVTASVREKDTPPAPGAEAADMTMTPIAIASTKDDIISISEKIVGKKLEENQENHHGVFSKQFVQFNNNGGNHQQNQNNNGGNTNGYSNGQTFHNKSYKNYGNRRQYQNNNHEYTNYNNTHHHHHHNNNNHHYNNQNGHHYNNMHQNGQQNHYNNNRQQRVHNNYANPPNGGQGGPNHHNQQHHNGNGDQQINSLISPCKIIDENLYTTMLANKRRQQPQQQSQPTTPATTTTTTPTWNPLENESSGILTLNNKPFYTQPPPNIQPQQQNQLQAPTTATTTTTAATNTSAINNTSSNSSSSTNNNSHQRQPSPSPSSISNSSTSSNNSSSSSSNKSHSSTSNGGPIVQQQQQQATNCIPPTSQQQNGGSYNNNNNNMYVNGFYRHGGYNNGYDIYNNGGGGRRQNHKNNNNNNNNNQFHYHLGYYTQPPPTSPSNFQQFCQQVPPPSLNILQRTNTTKSKSSANSVNSSDSNESIMSVTPEKSCTATTPCTGKNFLVGDWAAVNGSGVEMENTFYVEAENDYNCYSSRCESPGASSVSSQSSINNSIMNNNPKKSRYHSGGSCSEISNGIMANNSIMEVSKSPIIFRARKTNFPTIWNLKIDPVELVKDFSAIEMRDKPIGWNISEDDRYYELSKDIWKKFIENQQTMETFQKKMELWRDVYEVLKTNVNHPYSKYGLQVVGSTMSGFGSNSSDVDMCLLIRRTDVDQRYEAVDRLHGLLVTFRQTSFVENPEIIYAKVPILKFHDRIRNLDVDLNCNNYVGVRNTHLLYAYSQLDWRVKPLVLIVKLWAQIQGINDAKSMTISSYSLVLMVIHYLQTTDISVLPCLHQMYPDKFSPYVDVLKIKINEVFPRWNSKNNASLGELLLGFLDYYAVRFDFSRLAVSIRLGSTVSIKQCMQAKSYKNDPHQWKYICIEEPFDFTNTARSVYDKNAFDRIRGVFYISYQYLISTRRLDSIFNKISGEEARITADRLFPSLLNISS